MGVCEGGNISSSSLCVWYLPSPRPLTLCDSLPGIVLLVLPGFKALAPGRLLNQGIADSRLKAALQAPLQEAGAPCSAGVILGARHQAGEQIARRKRD